MKIDLDLDLYLYLLDTNFIKTKLIENIISLLWIERYYEYSTFELIIPYYEGIINDFQFDYYLTSNVTTKCMIIEKIKIEEDVENYTKVIIGGRSFESILDRRIIWGRLMLDNKTIIEIVYLLLSASFMHTGLDARTIPNFKWLEPNNINLSTLVRKSYEKTGGNIYEEVTKLLREYNYGYKIWPESGNIFFQIYYGNERDIVFSPYYDNLLKSNVLLDQTSLKNNCLIAGEGEQQERVYTSIFNNFSNPFYNRELFVDARDLQRKNDNQITPMGTYVEILKKRGESKLSDHEKKIVFEAKISNYGNYILNKDYFLGDICNIKTGYGFNERIRITDVVYSLDENGFEIYPEFEIVK